MAPGRAEAPAGGDPPWAHELAAAVRGHALGWLIAANAVGVLLAGMLVWPAAGDTLGALSYGRWMPVHLNGQLYGWCALPLVGALLAGCLEPGHPDAARHARWVLRAWTAALALGVASWLGGISSGKLFLDWAGWARPVLGVAMAALWTLVGAHLWWGRARSGTIRWRVAAGMVAALAAVPGMMYWAAGREVYPSVNPDSGGATGASLLGSTLGIVTVFGLLPVLLGMKRRDGARSAAWFWWALAGSFGVFAALDRGHASHHAAGQIAGLGLLLGWVPLLWIYGYGWTWSTGSRRWVLAAGTWWAALVTSGWVTFLPGISEATKFTHSLVGHAHLAMAGLVTSVNFAVLNELAPARPAGGRGVFWVWQTGCVAHVGLMLALGAVEADHAADLFYGVEWTQMVFVGRLAAGLAMLGAAVWAWRETRGETAATPGRFMNKSTWGTMKLARALAWTAGAMDLATGLGLVLAPAWTLGWMGVATPGAEALVFLRWVGAFVGAVGASYLVTVARGGAERLRGVMELTILFRVAAGGYAAVAVTTGGLEARWFVVAATDLSLVAVQIWLLNRKGWSDV